MSIQVLYMDRSRIRRGIKLSIREIKIFTCACAVEFRGFLKKLWKYRRGLKGLQRKPPIAHRIGSLLFPFLRLRSQNCACAEVTFLKFQKKCFFSQISVYNMWVRGWRRGWGRGWGRGNFRLYMLFSSLIYYTTTGHYDGHIYF